MHNSDLEESIKKAALLNAIDHNGKAQVGSVIGKIIAENQDLKKRIKEFSKLINQIVTEINSLSLEKQKLIIKSKWPETIEKEKIKEQKSLPSLLNVEKYSQVITRFSPNPDCVLHLGSARAIILSHEYARKYKGKFILRFEDTDPKVKKPILEFYDKIREDLAWLNCTADAEFIQSDRLPVYYKYTKKLLDQAKAYVCTCKPDDFRKKINEKKPCNCRRFSAKENSNGTSRQN